MRARPRRLGGTTHAAGGQRGAACSSGSGSGDEDEEEEGERGARRGGGGGGSSGGSEDGGDAQDPGEEASMARELVARFNGPDTGASPSGGGGGRAASHRSPAGPGDAGGANGHGDGCSSESSSEHHDDDEDEEEGDDGSEGSGDGDEEYRAAAPFFGPPPKAYRVELSPFNLLWSLLSSWVTRETIAYLRAAPSAPSGRPAPAAAVGRGGGEEEEEESGAARAVLVALPPPSATAVQARAVLAELLHPHLAAALEGMQRGAGGPTVAAGEVYKRTTALLRTLLFRSLPLPALSWGQRRLLALSVLRALSVARVPAAAALFEREGGGQRLADLLSGTGFELPHFSALLDLWLYD